MQKANVTQTRSHKNTRADESGQIMKKRTKREQKKVKPERKKKRKNVTTMTWKQATVNRSVRVPNLWWRGGSGDTVAALLVSAEHKLP